MCDRQTLDFIKLLILYECLFPNRATACGESSPFYKVLLMRTKKGHVEVEQNVIDLKAKRIAEQNDHIRKNFINTVITSGVLALEPFSFHVALVKVVFFDKFTEDNDPYGERDFGMVDVFGTSIYWKIDYDHQKDHRYMTILLAEEY